MRAQEKGHPSTKKRCKRNDNNHDDDDDDDNDDDNAKDSRNPTSSHQLDLPLESSNVAPQVAVRPDHLSHQITHGTKRGAVKVAA